MDTGTGMPTPNASTATKIHLCLLNNWHIWHVHSLLFPWWAFWSIECCRIIVYIVYTYNFPTHSSLYSSFAGKFLWHVSQLGVMTSPAFSPMDQNHDPQLISVAAHVVSLPPSVPGSPNKFPKSKNCLMETPFGGGKNDHFLYLWWKSSIFDYMGYLLKTCFKICGIFLMDKLPFKAAGAVDLECT